MPAITIGSVTFLTKKIAGDAVREIATRHPERRPISGPDADLLRHLIERHPAAAEKVGVGVSHFTWRFPERGKGVRFWLHRIDGTADDFSFLKCITHPTPEREAKDSLRLAVDDQILRFRRRFFDEIVPALPADDERRHWTNGPHLHVDHNTESGPSFDQIAGEFIASEGGVGRIALRRQPGGWGMGLADEDQAARWAIFHESRAVLRVIPARQNLSMPKAPYRGDDLDGR